MSIAFRSYQPPATQTELARNCLRADLTRRQHPPSEQHQRKDRTPEQQLVSVVWELASSVCSGEYDLGKATRLFERALCIEALIRCEGNASNAAKLIGAHRNTIGRLVPAKMQQKLRAQLRNPQSKEGQ
jgi:transcriptional regulator with GAF, ATPase, and Fis domain